MYKNHLEFLEPNKTVFKDHWEKNALASMTAAAQKEGEMAIKEGRVDKNGVPIIDVILDGCWSKRTYKKKYSALSGAAAIIGRKTGEVVHVMCADSTLGADYEDFRSKITCMSCTQTENRKINKEKTIEGLGAQANAMKQLSEQTFSPITIGKTVTIIFPSFDRAKGDPRNVLGITPDKTDDGLYRVGTKHGTLKQLFSL
ncbi:unnamed protein product [Diatraea saccharalis]|uniref:Mutator-like transposase domain-containing protein n=1 Tax=Diatraea saccharalis TaxID=40085 RepID=A0A9N9REH5_9NEOP|nr:unnamed protein product [Diatraea saccharalis]